MSTKKQTTLIKVKFPDHTTYLVYNEKENQFVPLDEARLSHLMPGYTRLNRKARRAERKSLIKYSEIIKTVRIPQYLKNTKVTKLPPKKARAAARFLLAIAGTFKSSQPGYTLLADILCGLHGQALRQAEPTFNPGVSITSSSQKIQKFLKALINAVVTRQNWHIKKGNIRRKAILNFSTLPGDLPRHIQDFSRLKVSVRNYKSLRIAVPYTDTVALMIGANSTQVRETAPYLENAAVIFLNSDASDLKPTKIPNSDISEYDPEVTVQLKKNRKKIAQLLLRWWGAFRREDAWAAEIVEDARASFGNPDSRYIHVELDPKRLRNSIRYRVLLDFMAWLENVGLMDTEELAPYRQGARDVFDPAPQEEVPLRHAEDLDVFVEIMTDLLAANADSIVAEDERYVKKDHPFAAWRSIGKTRYLVLDEAVWIKAYKKAIKERKELDASFFEKETWPQALQKKLSEEGTIKHTGNSYRYRYDLYGNGTKDQTYVVAIPAEILGNRAAKSQA